MDVGQDERDPSGNLSVVKSAPFTLDWALTPPPLGKFQSQTAFFSSVQLPLVINLLKNADLDAGLVAGVTWMDTWMQTWRLDCMLYPHNAVPLDWMLHPSHSVPFMCLFPVYFQSQMLQSPGWTAGCRTGCWTLVTLMFNLVQSLS